MNLNKISKLTFIFIFCNFTFILHCMEISKNNSKNNVVKINTLKEKILIYYANKINQDKLFSNEYSKFTQELKNLNPEDIKKLNFYLKYIKFENIKFNKDLWKKYLILGIDAKKINIPKNKNFNNLELVINSDIEKLAQVYFEDFFNEKNLSQIPKWFQYLPKELQNEIRILYFIKFKDFIDKKDLIKTSYNNINQWIKDFQKRNLIFDISTEKYQNIINFNKNKFEHTKKLIVKNNIDDMSEEEIIFSFALVALDECIIKNNFEDIPAWVDLLPRECQNEAQTIICYYFPEEENDNKILEKILSEKTEIQNYSNKSEKKEKQNKQKKKVRFNLPKETILHTYIQ